MDLVVEIQELREIIDALKTELQTVKLAMVQMQMAQDPLLSKQAQKSREGLLKSFLKLEKGSTAVPAPSQRAIQSTMTPVPSTATAIQTPPSLTKKFMNFIR